MQRRPAETDPNRAHIHERERRERSGPLHLPIQLQIRYQDGYVR